MNNQTTKDDKKIGKIVSGLIMDRAIEDAEKLLEELKKMDGVNLKEDVENKIDRVIVEFALFYFYMLNRLMSFKEFSEKHLNGFGKKDFIDDLKNFPQFRETIKSNEVKTTIDKLYEKRKEEYDGYEKISFEEGEAAKNTLIWEFCKRITNILGNKDNAFAILIVDSIIMTATKYLITSLGEIKEGEVEV